MYVLGSQIPIKHRSFPNFAATLGVMTSAVASNELRNRLAANVIANAWKESRNILALSDRIEQLHVIKALLVERANLPESDIGIFVGGLSAAEQNRIKESCRIILATFGMFKEGQDVPRMDFGMDLSPRSDAVQQLGRIRRAYHNKPHPMWVTFFDHNGSSIIQGMATSRIKDARSCGCNIVNVFDNCGQHGEGALRYLQSKMKI
jgi:superfamily II DNA or RNA helicase